MGGRWQHPGAGGSSLYAVTGGKLLSSVGLGLRWWAWNEDVMQVCHHVSLGWFQFLDGLTPGV